MKLLKIFNPKKKIILNKIDQHFVTPEKIWSYCLCKSLKEYINPEIKCDGYVCTILINVTKGSVGIFLEDTKLKKKITFEKILNLGIHKLPLNFKKSRVLTS